MLHLLAACASYRQQRLSMGSLISFALVVNFLALNSTATTATTLAGYVETIRIVPRHHQLPPPAALCQASVQRLRSAKSQKLHFFLFR